MTQPKKLIEVAMPVKEVSAESVRDKSIRHGHISTLHLWWARRPLPVCRAVVFASLVPDPLDENCPAPFKQAVAKYLADKKYKPYDDIPHTAAIDPMEDNLRNRLLMFIGRFSDAYVKNEKEGKKTASKKQLSDGSLIKWENKNNPKIIGIARKLIFIAHNTSDDSTVGGNISPVPGEISDEGGQRGNKTSLLQLEEKFNKLWSAITSAETNLYSTPNRHNETNEIKTKEKALHEAIENFLDHMPRVFDPFAGGGAIPLEAARLGCRTYGNDINPVAHIIQRGSVEFPQKYGKPITFTRKEFVNQYPVFAEEQILNTVGEPNYNYSLNADIEVEGYEDALSKQTALKNATEIHVKNRLAFDVEYYARQMLAGAEKEIGQYYPKVNGKKPAAYYWVKVGKCENPSCAANVPLLKQFYLSQRRGASKNNWVNFSPKIEGKEINLDIGKGRIDLPGWNNRGNLICPVCGNTTDVKEIKKQSVKGELSERLIAVIEEKSAKNRFRVPSEKEISIVKEIASQEIPIEKMQKNSAGGDTLSWGINKWGQLFSKRQLLVLNTLKDKIKELIEFLPFESDYKQAILVYLAFLLDRIAMRNNKHSRWHLKQDTIENIFGRQAISLIFDFPEMNPFSNFTSSASNQIRQIIDYIKEEGSNFNITKCNNSESGNKAQFEPKYLNAVITDPPYYDSIAYADISDFFYVWLKRILGDTMPYNFATPQTPKLEECTALKHHHQNSSEKAKKHFENKLHQIFAAIEKQTNGVVSIMFAHQSTEAWTTLCNSILGANMNISGSWAIDTETTTGLKHNKAFLSSSVTVSCKPNIQVGFAGFKKIKSKIGERISIEVKELYTSGFRGADLLTACFGKAVSEFGEYQTVEKADGTPVKVSELLELARDAAFNAIISDIETDDITKFYIGWLNLFGFTQAGHDDVMRITQVGLSVEVADLNHHGIFETSGSKQSLAGYKTRCETNQRLGMQSTSFAIDKIHRALYLFAIGDRAKLVEYLGEAAPSSDAPFWRIATALAEVLPPGCDDHKQLAGIMANKESLVRDAFKSKQEKPEQGKFEI